MKKIILVLINSSLIALLSGCNVPAAEFQSGFASDYYYGQNIYSTGPGIELNRHYVYGLGDYAYWRNMRDFKQINRAFSPHVAKDYYY